MPTDWNPSALLAWWFGAPDVVPTRLSADLPGPLLDLYEALSGYPALPVAWRNRLLGSDAVEMDGGMLVFWVDREEASRWATDGDEVFELTQGSDTWMPTELTLAEFVVSLLVFEIAVASQHSTTAEVAEDDLDFALDGFEDVPLPGPLVDSALYVAPDAVVFASDGILCLAARTPAALARYERRL